MFLKTDPKATWSATARGLQISLDEQSAAELTVRRDKPASISVCRGSCRVTSGKKKPQEVAADNTLVCKPGAEDLTVEPLTAAGRKRIEAWTVAEKPSQGLGQLLIRDAQSGAPKRLNVARYHVHVVLQPPVALIQIDQSFYNPYNVQEEGTFVFNLPRGASVSRFAMYVQPNELIEGELIERGRAANIYRSIVTRKRDPAILEQIGDNLFRMRVFPIFARDTKRILLDYTVPLQADRGRCRFRLPLFSDLKPIWDFRLSGVIRGAASRESVASRSHPELAFSKRKDGAIEFELAQKHYKPRTDFSLSFIQPTGGEATLRSYLAGPLPPRADADGSAVRDEWRSRSATYFHVSLPPEADRPAKQSPTPADVLILADTSSGMRGCKLLGRAVRTVVHNLRPADRFRLVCVDVAGRPLHDGWLTPGEAEAEAALDGFDREFCLGGTDLAGCFQAALESFDAPDAKRRRRLVVYVGDGEDTLSSLAWANAPEVLARFDRAGAALFGVLVRNSAAGRDLVESLARSTGGLVFDLVENWDGQRELFEWLLAGVPSPQKIIKIEIEGAKAEDLHYPTARLPGQSLHVLGRTLRTDRVKLTLTTAGDGKPRTRHWELSTSLEDEAVFVGRLWAQRKLDELGRLDDAGLTTMEQNRQIAWLSQEWSLLSPRTAFLVLERESDYRQWKIDRRQRRRYWKPADALPQTPLPDDWLALVKVDPQQGGFESESARFAGTVRSAEKALADGDHSLAYSLLHKAARFSQAATSSEYAKLSRRALDASRMEAFLNQLGVHRSLLDPTVPAGPIDFQPDLWPLLATSSDASPEFLRRHPYARHLLGEVRVQTRTGEGAPST